MRCKCGGPVYRGPCPTCNPRQANPFSFSPEPPEPSALELIESIREDLCSMVERARTTVRSAYLKKVVLPKLAALERAISVEPTASPEPEEAPQNSE